jgi:hypothetical protein
MTTTDAAFDSWEKRWAFYYAHGGNATFYAALAADEKLPGRVVQPTSASSWLTVTRSDPRGNVIFPNAFRVETIRNALEPTAAEWENYAIQQVFRDGGGVNDLEAVETSSGVWVVRNTADIVFPAAGAASTGGTYTHAVLLIGNYAATPPVPLYSTLVVELDVAITIPAGGTAAITIVANDLEFEIR